MERIDQYVEGVAWKHLSAVDAESKRSNQHELGGLVKAGFLRFLGDPGKDTTRLRTRYVFLAEDEANCISVTGGASWYDARRKQPHRSPELRLYYENNPVTEQLSEGMFALVAKLRTNELLLVFSNAGSSAEQQLRWLFGIDESGGQFRGRTLDQGLERTSWAAMWVLEQIGIEVQLPEEMWLERIISAFGEKFPATREFSEFARKAVPEINVVQDPDGALMRFTVTEERFFRLLERHIVQKRLDQSFDSVDEFISYSLSVHNTRKSRAGYSFENHLEFIFKAHGLRFERSVYTPPKSEVDFLFPGIREYLNDEYPSSKLTMLGAKTTCKDRWRQVLNEAQRFEERHLATLEPGISESQTDEMRRSRLQLVIPSELHETYTTSQQSWLWTLDDFIQMRRSHDDAG